MRCLSPDLLILIKGAGDLATGVAWRLHRAGLTVIMTETAQPTAIRRTVSFAQAVYDGEITVEGVTARAVIGRRGDAETRGLPPSPHPPISPSQVAEALRRGIIPVLVDPRALAIRQFRPQVVVDAIVAKRNLGTRLDDAPLVIALGPGFVAGVDAHAVIETNRGHNLGRVLYSGMAEANTGIPGEVAGHGEERVLRAPVAGVFQGRKAIGDGVARGDVVATVDGQPVLARLDGVLRGLLHDGLTVTPGMKVGDVDPRAQRQHCFTISDKALAVAGGVLEAILTWHARSATPGGTTRQQLT